jgi:hypothetical protein
MKYHSSNTVASLCFQLNQFANPDLLPLFNWNNQNGVNVPSSSLANRMDTSGRADLSARRGRGPTNRDRNLSRIS